MMGLSVTPTANQAIELLTLLSDPEKAAARIAEFDQVKSASEQAAADAAKAKTDLQALQDELAREHAAREERIVQKEAELDQREADLNAKAEAHQKWVDDTTRALSSDRAVLCGQAADHATKERALADKEAALALQQKKADEVSAAAMTVQQSAVNAHEAAQKLKADYEARISELRKLVNDPVSPPLAGVGVGRTDAGVR